MRTRSPLTAALISAALLATLPLAASAQETVVVETVTATPYVNGGVGKDGRDLYFHWEGTPKA
jgi:hypothetical protein